MKEKTVLVVLVLIASMLAMVIIPVGAWEYWNTTIANPQTDNLTDFSGPHADRILIKLFADEIAEFAALETGQIDLTDWPVDAAHFSSWTNPPLDQDIAVVNTGPGFQMYILDMKLDNRTTLDDGSPNPAYTTPFGNPMADVWLRRAIAAVVDRKQTIEQIVSGGTMPLLGEAMYTPLDTAYGAWLHPELNPTGALQAYTYVNPDGSANIALGNQFLDDHGYTMVGGKRTKEGVPFSLEFYYRIDHTQRRDFATAILQPLLTQTPPEGLGLNVQMIGVNVNGAQHEVKSLKKGHMYTAGWGVPTEPSHLYYLFHAANSWHPGVPTNYMFYPGDADRYTVPVDGWTYTGFPEIYGWLGSGLNFADPDKTWNAGDEVWMNPQNYWSWEMMTATDFDRALLCAYKSQEAIAYEVCGVPVWASISYTAFHRTYVGDGLSVTGPEDIWENQPWKGVVNRKSVGVWDTMSFYDMHPANALFGDGSHMTIRWGFRAPPVSLNPIYAEWAWDIYVLNKCYDGLTGIDPYTLADVGRLATSWEIGTWDSSDYGTCTKVTFNLRHDIKWSDGMPFTSSDVKFTMGGPDVTGSLSNLLLKKGYPPAVWSSRVADILSIATPDPWTVTVYLDVNTGFGSLGFLAILPEHVWKPIIETGDPTQPWDQPCVVTGGYIIDSTHDPAPIGYILLHKNPLHFRMSETEYPKDKPINIWTSQTSNAREVYGNTHYIYPKLGDVTIDLGVNACLHNYYLYETGPYKEDLYPENYLDGTKTVTLLAWNGVGSPGNPANYVPYLVIATDAPWSAYRCETEIEHYDILGIPAWWYMIKVDITINSLHYYDGAAWVDASGANPFNGMTYTYREYAIVTSRYDIGGTNMKPYTAVKYQPISDVKVDVKDLFACGKAYGTQPGYANWNTACDVNNDFKVDVKDYFKIAQNYGWAATSPLP